LDAPFIRETAEGVVLSIKLRPRASRNQIAGVHGNELKISVTAPPVDSAANEALIAFLAELLDRSRSSILLVRGQTSRHKTILLRGFTTAQIQTKLNIR